MKLALLCTAVVLLMSAVELARLRSRKRTSIPQIYKAANITPVPESILQVYFEDVIVTIGKEITPILVKDLPDIEFDFEIGCYYTFMGTSPDWPSRHDPYLSNTLFGLYVNLYGCSDGTVLTEDSCVITPWIGPIPTPGTGPHRYLLYVFKQKGIIDTTDEVIQSLRYDRLVFSPVDFVKAYDLISPPVAGTFFYSRFPEKECECECD